MLKNLFRRAVADLDKVTFVAGATGTLEWTDGRGRDIERYHLEKDSIRGQWKLVHSYTATNRADEGEHIIATIPRLEDAAVILRGVLESDLKSHYAGFVNIARGRSEE